MNDVAASLFVIATLAVPCTSAAESSALGDFASSLRPDEGSKPCPVPVSAEVVWKTDYFALSFTVENPTERSVTVDSNLLPWGAWSQLKLVGLSTDGTQLWYVPPIGDAFRPNPVAFPAHSKLQGFVPLPWASKQLPLAPKSDVLVLWAFQYRLEGDLRKATGICSGVSLLTVGWAMTEKRLTSGWSDRYG